MTTQNDIRGWLDRKQPEHTHMLVVCDSFDYSDYPVYTKDVDASIKQYKKASMQRIMEVYDLSMDLEKQLTGGRVWNDNP